MNRSEWMGLLLAVPATVVTTLGVVAWVFREKADAWVFRVLGRNHGKWVEEAEKVPGFVPLFEAASIIPEVRDMRAAMDHRLDQLIIIPQELAMMKSTIGHFTESVNRLANEVKDLPARLAVVEDRVRRSRGHQP